jgi:hypothetical protein
MLLQVDQPIGLQYSQQIKLLIYMLIIIGLHDYSPFLALHTVIDFWEAEILLKLVLSNNQSVNQSLEITIVYIKQISS